MLEVDADKRITAEETLAHPYLAEVKQSSSPSFDRERRETIPTFNGKKHFWRQKFYRQNCNDVTKIISYEVFSEKIQPPGNQCFTFSLLTSSTSLSDGLYITPTSLTPFIPTVCGPDWWAKFTSVRPNIWRLRTLNSRLERWYQSLNGSIEK